MFLVKSLINVPNPTIFCDICNSIGYGSSPGKVYSLKAYEFEAPKVEVVLDPVYRKLELNKDKHLTIPEPLVRSILNQGGIGKTVNIYGKALVIEEVNPLMDGSVELVMRKENGKSFFNYYPKVKARLMPNENKNVNTITTEF